MKARAVTRPRAGTRRRVLRTGQSTWSTAPARSLPSQRLGDDIECEAVIVGAGISGAIMAHALSSHLSDIIVVDRRGPALGSTLANTAIITFELDRALFELSERIGAAGARRAWKRAVTSVENLRQIVSREQLQCQWTDRASLYVAGDTYGHRALAREASARERAGLPGQYLSAAELQAGFGIDRTGAVVSPTGAATADPVALTAGLFRTAITRGARLMAPVDVREVAATRDRARLETDSGHFITARYAIFCTGYEILKGIEPSGHSPRSTWAIATTRHSDFPGWLDHMVVWEASDPYSYYRTTADGRIVAGGQDEAGPHEHTDPPTLTRKARRIKRVLDSLIPDVTGDTEYCWGGTFGESSTGLPIIDRVPHLPGCFMVMGFGGNGISHSVLGAEIVTSWILGHRDPDADLYGLEE
ncbi:MAG: NAD(P)/FAD-dependent oxidoreductase [Gemmatimonadota bacterium]